MTGASVGYRTLDPPLEHVVLYRFGRTQPPQKWFPGGPWVNAPEFMRDLLSPTEITEQTEERVRELFPGAIEEDV